MQANLVHQRSDKEIRMFGDCWCKIVLHVRCLSYHQAFTFVSVLCFQILEKIVKTSDVSGIYEQEDVLMQRSRVSVDVQMYVH